MLAGLTPSRLPTASRSTRTWTSRYCDRPVYGVGRGSNDWSTLRLCRQRRPGSQDGRDSRRLQDLVDEWPLGVHPGVDAALTARVGGALGAPRRQARDLSHAAGVDVGRPAAVSVAGIEAISA